MSKNDIINFYEHPGEVGREPGGAQDDAGDRGR